MITIELKNLEIIIKIKINYKIKKIFETINFDYYRFFFESSRPTLFTFLKKKIIFNVC